MESPSSLADLSAALSAACARGDCVLPVGCGSKWPLRPPPRRCDTVISSRRLCSIVAHEAGDMTVTVGAGLTIAELNARLAQAGQYLPLDPPIPETTTLGSAVATDAFGPSRMSQGKVRDLLIGITAVLADGTIVKGGGRVVKNVAGYDVMKLLTGSYGTLAVIAEATFKLRPLPEVQADFVVLQPTLHEALDLGRRVISAPVVPLYLDVLNPNAAALLGLDGAIVQVGCAGSAIEVEAQRQRLNSLTAGKELAGANGTSAYVALRDLPATTVNRGILGAKISVLRSRLPDLLCNLEAEVGVQRPLSTIAQLGVGTALLRVADPTAAIAEQIVQHVAAAGGWVMFDAVPEFLRGDVAAWPLLPPGINLMHAIKRALDPDDRLSPGCYVGGI